MHPTRVSSSTLTPSTAYPKPLTFTRWLSSAARRQSIWRLAAEESHLVKVSGFGYAVEGVKVLEDTRVGCMRLQLDHALPAAGLVSLRGQFSAAESAPARAEQQF